MQTELTLSAARVRRPCVERSGAKAILDCEDWQLDRYLDEGRISGVLNIAQPHCQRRELRFSVVACEEWKQGQTPERSAEELTTLLFGREQPLVRVRWIYSRLICKHSHFYDLISAGVLRAAEGSIARTGPGGSAVIPWPELVRFIKQRRVS